MIQVDMFQAKTDLSKLIRSLEQGEQDVIVITRDGKPVAKLKQYDPEHQDIILGRFNHIRQEVPHL
ncbi:MAG: type II toxin-antitoxin system Phd/YefM family antitoxin [Eubacterium sp.]|nr:type II toxin-antitoxin system Phd/YefM family antitoxin [Eubacterium sp.]